VRTFHLPFSFSLYTAHITDQRFCLYQLDSNTFAHTQLPTWYDVKIQGIQKIMQSFPPIMAPSLDRGKVVQRLHPGVRLL
jgi:hypothetical protein